MTIEDLFFELDYLLNRSDLLFPPHNYPLFLSKTGEIILSGELFQWAIQ